MKKIKILPLLALCLCLLTACKQRPLVLNGFESVQALYSIRPAIQLMDGAVDIVPTHVRSGSGSARLSYENGAPPLSCPAPGPHRPPRSGHFQNTHHAALGVE